jgi:putative ABC transport system substrate-binding protein
VLRPQGPPQSLDAFWGRLNELGYVEGQNLIKEERGDAGTRARGESAALAAELVQLPLDVLFAPGGGARAAIAATTSIPIVVANVDDPVEAGFVESLARPGGNVTGVVGDRRGLDAKRLQLLVEAVPNATKVAAFGFVDEPDSRLVAAAAALGVELLYLRVTADDGYPPAIERAAAAGADALLFQQSPVTVTHPENASLAMQYRLPSMHHPLAQDRRAHGLLGALI